MHKTRALASAFFGLALFLTLASSAVAQTSPITLSVDLREAPRHIFHARLTVPAAPGPLTLLYPKWIPGEHGPTGPITNLVGLKLSAAGKPLAWRRDDVEMFAFHCDVPAGAKSVEVELDYVSPVEKSVRAGRGPASTAHLAVLNWNLVLLYPQGKTSDELTYTASLRLPAGWKFGSALPVARQSGDTVEFSSVSLTTLVDSPLLAGDYFRKVPLTVAGAPPHQLDLAGESEAAIAISPQLTENYTRLVAEALALFGAYHYRHYDLLLALSNNVRPSGLEHHESSDNRLGERALLDDAERIFGAGLLPHEFVHSWNAKYRRPAGLATPDYSQPMKGELLWVYEGLTNYLGEILTARSGLLTEAQWHDQVARVAAHLDNRPGRTWRPLADTAVAAQTLYGSPSEWDAWRRSVDFYDESTLLWLEADVIIRRETRGQKSLDDFCKLFHGGTSGPPELKTYTLDDVVAALNQVAAYDWRGFFRARVDSIAPRAPLGGIEGAGWRLVYNATPNAFIAASKESDDVLDLFYSLGLSLNAKDNDPDSGAILDVIPGSPAAQAGIAPGMKLVAVNGRAWSSKRLLDAIRGAQASRKPIELAVANGSSLTTYAVSYFEGERYPHLERDASKPDLLSEILKPHAKR